MNYSSIFLLLPIFLFSCSVQRAGVPEDYQVQIKTESDHHIWYGVIENSSSLLTAYHVYLECKKNNCIYMKNDGSRIQIKNSHARENLQDSIRLESLPASSLPSLSIRKPMLSEDIFALVSRSGSWHRIHGKVLALDQEYIAYDALLSGTLLSGATLTDIVLEKWESGAPIWSSSWWLLWVMSAVDREGKRSWFVQ